MKVKYWEFVPVYAMLCIAILVIVALVNKTANVMAENTLMEQRHCIVIDAGHGGVDGGATSCTGILESGINLEISCRLNDLLHLLGHNTKMIRTTDISIHTYGNSIAEKKLSDLKERTKIVNETQNSILISIHQNYFQESKYAGAQIFYGKTEDSKTLAKTLQDNFKRTINIGSKRIEKKSSGIYLIENVNTTAVLVECGFLSNPAEEAKLRDAEYQKLVCCVIGASVSTFLS